jgi:NADPH-dependent curcumin reductase CurA
MAGDGTSPTHEVSLNDKNLQIVLAHRPDGRVQESDFRLVEAAVPTPGPGQFLVRNHFLSLDPYMRRRMTTARSYARHVELGEVMVGGTVGEIVESRNPQFHVGDRVRAMFGWQQYGVSDGSNVQRIEARDLPISVYLGAVGMPGVTAHYGLLELGKPKTGQTVVVSAASGAVGSAVGQIARLRGSRAVGIAGGPEKCRYVVDELGFDACLDYKAGNLAAELADATPDGVDVYFDNVGGEILDTVLARINPFARIPLCGVISQYDSAGETYGVRRIGHLLWNRATLQGFIISDHMPYWPGALADLEGWVRDGSLKYRESVADGIENAPAAFVGLLAGRNFGKQLVKLV